MVGYSDADEELQLSSDGNDEEYVQSDGEDDLLHVGRSQPVGGLNTRRRQGTAGVSGSAGRAERPSRQQRPAPRVRPPPRRRSPARNEIDAREDEEEEDYESDGHAAASHSEVGLPCLVCLGRVRRLTVSVAG